MARNEEDYFWIHLPYALRWAYSYASENRLDINRNLLNLELSFLWRIRIGMEKFLHCQWNKVDFKIHITLSILHFRFRFIESLHDIQCVILRCNICVSCAVSVLHLHYRQPQKKKPKTLLADKSHSILLRTSCDNTLSSTSTVLLESFRLQNCQFNSCTCSFPRRTVFWKPINCLSLSWIDL